MFIPKCNGGKLQQMNEKIQLAPYLRFKM